MAEKTKIGIYDEVNFTEKQSFEVEGKTDRTEILYMTVSQDQKKVGVALGENVIKDQYKVT